ncbi:hypothetical protein GCM10010211_81320 [Streptomyces albospinus]|uniref:Uncharacterized protein n=1 Tax=Streptomyces albospinus TaxID=285515 RepID=A0ABQ2VQS1_9ACTN|nr:hypothetical protein GCM10010211_81320 [Streptomyces albospinus]
MEEVARLGKSRSLPPLTGAKSACNQRWRCPPSRWVKSVRLRTIQGVMPRSPPQVIVCVALVAVELD